MTAQTLQSLMLPDPHVGMAGGITYGSFLIDASTEKFAMVFRIPKTGNIHKIGFLTGTVGTSDTLKVGLQTLSGGDPTGTAYGGMTAGTQASLSSNTWYTVTLAGDASAMAGDEVAAVIEFNSFVAGSVNLQVINPSSAISRSFPYIGHYTGSWAKGPYAPVLYIEYDDGSTDHIAGVFPYSALAETAFNSGSTPDEYAIRFQVPFPSRYRGYWGWIGANGNYDVVLYDSDGTTALSTISVLAVNSTTAAARWIERKIATGVSLSANTTYRLAFKPTTGSNITINIATISTAAIFGQMEGGTAFYRSTRTDAGAWTDTTTSRLLAGLFLDQFDDATGGSGGGRLVSGSLAG